MNIKLIDIFRICIFAASFTTLLGGAVSCAEESLDMSRDVKIWTVDVAAETSVSTRISLDGVNMTWDKDDKLALLVRTEENDYAETELTIYDVDAGLPRAKFKGEVELTGAPAGCNFAVPVSGAVFSDGDIIFDYAAQDGSHSPYLYGFSHYAETGMEVAMHHVGAMVKISNSISNLSEITVKSNAGESISEIVCNAATGDVSVTETASDNFTVASSSGILGPEIYIAMPPVNFAKGFTLICKTSDDLVMHRSYSSDGTSTAGYDFSSAKNLGRLYPITLSGFDATGIEITSLTAEHTYDSNDYLTGTKVSLSLDKSGTADKIIDRWEASLVNASGEVVRTYSSAVKPESALLAGSDDLPYLTPGTYELTACYYIFGNKMAEATASVEVTVPDIIDVSAQTTYSLYMLSGGSAANNSGHSSMAIFDIGATLKVSDELFNHSKYKDTFTVTYSTDTGLSSGAMSAASQSHFLGFDVEVGAKQKYMVTATLSFGGYSYSDSIECHITGLPYDYNFCNGSLEQYRADGWTTNGALQVSNMSLAGRPTTLVLDKNGTWSNDHGFVVSPKFHIPSNLYVQASIARSSYRSSGNKKRTGYVGAVSNVNTSNKSSVTYVTEGGTGTGGTIYGKDIWLSSFELSDVSPYISIDSDERSEPGWSYYFLHEAHFRYAQ